MTGEHAFDDLPLVLTGEATRATVMRVAEHLRGCEDCRQELVSAVVAHASLMSAARYAPDLAAPRVSPTATAQDGSAEPADLPDISAVLARAHAEPAADAAPTGDELGVRRSRRTRAVSIAAAAVVVGALGVGGGLYATRDTGPTGRTVEVGAFGGGNTTARARIVGGELILDAASLPPLDSEHYYRVWLTNPQRTSMLALGTLSPTETGDYVVGTQVMNRYTDIEVSRQSLADGPAYSGQSVLRGSYS